MGNQKLVYIEGSSYAGKLDTSVVNDYINQGWSVQNVFPQRVSSEGSTGFGGFLVILKKLEL